MWSITIRQGYNEIEICHEDADKLLTLAQDLICMDPEISAKLQSVERGDKE